MKEKLEVKNYFKKVKDISYTLNVVDKEAPTITFNNKLSIEEGNELDLLKDVKVEDNSLEDIKTKVVGDYDLKSPNTYNLEYVAFDFSKEKVYFRSYKESRSKSSFLLICCT